MRKDRNGRKDNEKRPNNRRSRSPRREYNEDKSWDSTDKEKNSALNDISWYSKYPDLLAASANVPFPYRPGMSIPLGSYTASEKTYNVHMNIPGVMALSWMPSIGRSLYITDPINVAAKELYARVRAAYSGSLEADPPDFMVYLVALDSYFSYIGALKRIYRIIDAVSPNNFIIPETLLVALGIDNAALQNLRANKPQFLSYINQLCYQARKFNLPSVMDVFTRHYWMNDNVYTDDGTINSQFYCFREDFFWTFSMQNVVNDNGTPVTPAVLAGGLLMNPAPWVTGNVTVDSLYTYGLNMIQALASSDDAYTISGYLKRAYDGVPQFVVEPLNPDETLEPVYSPEVLTQIENSAAVLNATISMNSVELETQFIPQNVNKNILYFDPQMLASNTVYSAVNAPWYQSFFNKTPLTIRTDTPTAADVVIASRLHTCGTSFVGANVRIDAGTEIALRWTLYNQVTATDGTKVNLEYNLPYIFRLTASSGAVNNFVGQLAASQFDWRPMMFTVNQLDTPKQIAALVPFGDTHNITFIDVNQLQEINRICVLSEFNAFNLQ